MTRRRLPGRDPRAVRHAGQGGAPRVDGDKHVIVVGGGIVGRHAGGFERGVRRIRRVIAEGGVYQVNLTRRLTAPLPVVWPTAA